MELETILKIGDKCHFYAEKRLTKEINACKRNLEEDTYGPMLVDLIAFNQIGRKFDLAQAKEVYDTIVHGSIGRIPLKLVPHLCRQFILWFVDVGLIERTKEMLGVLSNMYEAYPINKEIAAVYLEALCLVDFTTYRLNNVEESTVTGHFALGSRVKETAVHGKDESVEADLDDIKQNLIFKIYNLTTGRICGDCRQQFPDMLDEVERNIEPYSISELITISIQLLALAKREFDDDCTNLYPLELLRLEKLISKKSLGELKMNNYFYLRLYYLFLYQGTTGDTIAIDIRQKHLEKFKSLVNYWQGRGSDIFTYDTTAHLYLPISGYNLQDTIRRFKGHI